MIRKVFISVILSILPVFFCQAISITEARKFVELYYSRIDSLAFEFLKKKERNNRTTELSQSLRAMFYDDMIFLPNDWMHFGFRNGEERLIARTYPIRLMKCIEQCEECKEVEWGFQAQVTTVEPVDTTFFVVGLNKEIRLGAKDVTFRDTVELRIDNNIPKIVSITGSAVSGSDLQRVDIATFTPEEREQFFGGLLQRINDVRSNLQLLGKEDLNVAVKQDIVQNLCGELMSSTINNEHAEAYIEKLSKGEVSPVKDKEIKRVSVCIPVGFVSTLNGKHLVWGDTYTYDFTLEGELKFSLSKEEKKMVEIHDVTTRPLRSIPQPDGTFTRRLKAFITNIEVWRSDEQTANEHRGDE